MVGVTKSMTALLGAIVRSIKMKKSNEEAFNKDGDSFTKTAVGYRKGVLVQFYHNEKPRYNETIRMKILPEDIFRMHLLFVYFFS